MATLLKIQSSLFQDQGQSSQLAARFAADWIARHPGARLLTRDLAANPVPHLDLERFQAFTSKPADRNPAQQALVAYSDTLIDELRQADVLVLAVPMYNFNIPSFLHSYFDHIARAGETFRYTNAGAEGLLNGKRAYVFIARGGLYGSEHAQTALLRQFLGFIGITDVEFIHAEGLAMGDDNRSNSLATAQDRIRTLLAA